MTTPAQPRQPKLLGLACVGAMAYRTRYMAATGAAKHWRDPTMPTTKSQAVAADVAALLRARNPLLWVVTREEQRAEKYLFEANAAANYETRFWDVAAGVTFLNGKADQSLDGLTDPDALLATIDKRAGERCVWVLRDLPVWMQPPAGPITLRRLRNLARSLPNQEGKDAQSIIIISPSAEVPAELANHATVINWPLPDREEIGALLDATVEPYAEQLPDAMVDGVREAAIDAAVGLSGEEAQATFARSLVQLRRIDPAIIAAEKERVIARDGLLEWVQPPAGGLSNIGGMENWTAWLKGRAAAFSPEARAYGLPSPKGALVVGVPGCGKSYSAKALASEWKVPLIRFDLGALKSKYVGESEGNLRKALGVIEAIGRCVVWLDEIEKALAGATGEAGDGGVSADALGTILSWMQDRQGEAFVIATANNADKLPPELMRKGRFDEVWWVDLPNRHEREGVTRSALRSYKRDADAINIDVAAIADATDTFTGAEIAALVPEALFVAFNEDAREITTNDLLAAAKDVVPLAKSMGSKIKELRENWLSKARPASNQLPVDSSEYRESRALDL